GGDRLVEQRLRAGDRAVEVAAAHRLAAQPAGAGGEVVEATTVFRAAAQQVAQRLPQAAAGQHLLADPVDGGAHVVRRGERVGTGTCRPWRDATGAPGFRPRGPPRRFRTRPCRAACWSPTRCRRSGPPAEARRGCRPAAARTRRPSRRPRSRTAPTPRTAGPP